MRLCDLFCHDLEIYTLALSIRAPVRLQRREPTIVTPCSTRHRFCVLNIEFTVYFWSFVLHFDGKLLTFAACAIVQETLFFDLQWNRPTPFNRRIFKQAESPARERYRETSWSSTYPGQFWLKIHQIYVIMRYCFSTYYEFYWHPVWIIIARTKKFQQHRYTDILNLIQQHHYNVRNVTTVLREQSTGTVCVSSYCVVIYEFSSGLFMCIFLRSTLCKSIADPAELWTLNVPRYNNDIQDCAFVLTSSDFACEYCDPISLKICLRHQYFEPWSRLINLLKTTQLIEFARIRRQHRLRWVEWNRMLRNSKEYRSPTYCTWVNGY